MFWLLLIIIGIISYFMFNAGRVYQANAEWREEQLAQEAYLWAAANDRLPTMTRVVDLDTGEVVEEMVR